MDEESKDRKVLASSSSREQRLQREMVDRLLEAMEEGVTGGKG